MSPRNARHCSRHWQAPASPACTQVSVYPSLPWPHGAPLCTQEMFGEHMHELVSVLTSVGFSNTTHLLTHQEGTGPEASLGQESMTSPEPGPLQCQSCSCVGHGVLGVSGVPFLGIPVKGIAREGRRKGQGLACS